jgi:DNA-binding transcriptional LysR family regulator
MQVFVRVAEAGGFTSVAREIGSTQPTVSRLVAALEDHLGARLFHRSTRAVSLTDDGKQFYELARHALETITEAENAFGKRRARAFGRLRLSIPVAFGRLHIAPRMPRFLELNPEVQIKLVMSDNFVDLVGEGIDLAVRIGEIADPTLIAPRIGTTRRVTAASRRYLKRRGEPSIPPILQPMTASSTPGSPPATNGISPVPMGISSSRCKADIKPIIPRGARRRAGRPRHWRHPNLAVQG